MASTSLGTKRHCQSCDGKFYDLNKDPIVCPSCGTVFDPEVLLKSRRAKPVAAAPAKPAEKVAEDPNEDENLDDVDTDIDNDDEVLEDDSDLVIVSGESNDEDEVAVADDMPMEDNLDTVDAGDEAEEE